MTSILHGLLLGVRSLVREPSYAVTIVVTLGAGLGLTALLFAVIQGTIRASLPFHHPEELVAIEAVVEESTDSSSGVDPVDFETWRRGLRTAIDLVAYREFFGMVELEGGRVEVYPAAEVTQGFFDVLGERLLVGHGLHPRPPAGATVRRAVLAHEVWARDFESNPDILGKSIVVNGESVQISGVMPAGFEFPNGQSIWLALDLSTVARRGREPLNVFGRIRGGRSPHVVERALRDVMRRDDSELARSSSPQTVRIRRFSSAHTDRRLRMALPVMMAAAVGVLLLACVNVANLLMVRMAKKMNALSVRRFLGASRRSLGVMIVTENLVPTVVAGVAGGAVAWVGLEVLRRLDTSAELFRGSWVALELDHPIILVLAVTTLSASLVASAGPIVHTLVTMNVSNIKQGRTIVGRSTGRGIFHRFLIAIEVTIAVALLIVTVMLAESVLRLRMFDAGISSRGVLTAKVSTMMSGLPVEEGAVLLADVVERVRSNPNVRRAGLISSLPSEGSYWRQIEVSENAGATISRRARWLIASPETVGVLGVPVIEGRFFDNRDRAGSLRVAVVNQSFVEQILGGRHPIEELVYTEFEPGAEEPMTIVGVVGDYVMGPIGDEESPAAIYTPLAQTPTHSVTLVLNADQSTLAGLESEVRAAVDSIDTSAVFFDVESMSSILAKRRWTYDAAGTVFASFGILSLVLVATGVYGVVASTVRRRRREFGLRATLGATPRNIEGSVLRKVGAELAIGLVAGSVLAYFSGEFLAAILFGISPSGAMPFFLGASIVSLSAALAAYVPARQAARIDPKEALLET